MKKYKWKPLSQQQLLDIQKVYPKAVKLTQNYRIISMLLECEAPIPHVELESGKPPAFIANAKKKLEQ